jgi:hypothetical protein
MIIVEKEYNNFVFLIGETSIDIFDYYGVNSMHGLNRRDASRKKDTNKSAYICGLCNYHPKDKSLERPSHMKPFIFMNSIRFQKDFTDVTSLMHECTHLSFMMHDWKSELEEEIVTYAESLTNDLYFEHYIKNVNNF